MGWKDTALGVVEAVKNNTLMTGIGVATAATVAGASIVAPMAQVQGFNLYKNPDHIEITYHSNELPNGTIWDQRLPYRAVLFGGMTQSATPQGYSGYVYVIYSRIPVLDIFTFEYRSSRGTTGQIRATLKKNALDSHFDLNPSNNNQWEGDWSVSRRSIGGFSGNEVGFYSSSMTGQTWLNDYIHFDFFYIDDSNLTVTGLTSIPSVPYGYIFHCATSSGGGWGEGGNQSSSSSGGGSSGGGSSGGGSSGGGSSGGGSSGGGSSGGGSSGGGSSGGGDGGSSGDESSRWPGEGDGGGPWEDDGKYPWESSSGPGNDFNPSVPDYKPGGEDAHGENGDGWKLPEWYKPEPPFNPDDLPDYEMPGGLLPGEKTPELPGLPDYQEPALPGLPDYKEPALPGLPDYKEPTLPGLPDYKEPEVPELPSGWPPSFPGKLRAKRS